MLRGGLLRHSWLKLTLRRTWEAVEMLGRGRRTRGICGSGLDKAGKIGELVKQRVESGCIIFLCFLLFLFKRSSNSLNSIFDQELSSFEELIVNLITSYEDFLTFFHTFI